MLGLPLPMLIFEVPVLILGSLCPFWGSLWGLRAHFGVTLPILGVFFGGAGVDFGVPEPILGVHVPMLGSLSSFGGLCGVCMTIFRVPMLILGSMSIFGSFLKVQV